MLAVYIIVDHADVADVVAIITIYPTLFLGIMNIAIFRVINSVTILSFSVTAWSAFVVLASIIAIVSLEQLICQCF